MNFTTKFLKTSVFLSELKFYFRSTFLSKLKPKHGWLTDRLSRYDDECALIVFWETIIECKYRATGKPTMKVIFFSQASKTDLDFFCFLNLLISLMINWISLLNNYLKIKSTSVASIILTAWTLSKWFFYSKEKVTGNKFAPFSSHQCWWTGQTTWTFIEGELVWIPFFGRHKHQIPFKWHSFLTWFQFQSKFSTFAVNSFFENGCFPVCKQLICCWNYSFHL